MFHRRRAKAMLETEVIDLKNNIDHLIQENTLLRKELKVADRQISILRCMMLLDPKRGSRGDTLSCA